jgi:hypothetical protein
LFFRLLTFFVRAIAPSVEARQDKEVLTTEGFLNGELVL